MDLLGFNNNNIANPAVRNYQWKGGLLNKQEEKIKFEERLEYYQKNEDGTGETKIGSLKEFAILGLGFGVTGVRSLGNNKYASIYSNGEILYNGKWGETMAKPVVVMESTSDSKKQLYHGSLINAIGNQKQGIAAQVEGAKSAISVYLYNFETKQVERLITSGSSAGAIRDMLFNNEPYKNIKMGAMVWSLSGESKEKTGSVTFFKPVFSPVRELNEKDGEVLLPLVDEVREYVLARESAMKTSFEEVVSEATEIVESGEADDTIDLSDIPF